MTTRRASALTMAALVCAAVPAAAGVRDTFHDHGDWTIACPRPADNAVGACAAVHRTSALEARGLALQRLHGGYRTLVMLPGVAHGEVAALRGHIGASASPAVGQAGLEAMIRGDRLAVVDRSFGAWLMREGRGAGAVEIEWSLKDGTGGAVSFTLDGFAEAVEELLRLDDAPAP